VSSPRRRFAAQRQSQPAGSPETSEPAFVLVGVLRRPHGLRGEALVSVETDFPERLKKGLRLFLGEDHTQLTIRSRRTTSDGLLLAFEEFSDRESLAHIRNESLFVRAVDSPQLPTGQFYQHQLIGLDVFTQEGSLLGKLVEVIDTAANDVYVLQSPQKKEILLPAIRDVIRNVDLENKRMTVHLLPGLLPED
jgi:16S rRNA processing protein RimM